MSFRFGKCVGISIVNNLPKGDNYLKVVRNELVCIRQNNTECFLDTRNLCSECQKFTRKNENDKIQKIKLRFKAEMDLFEKREKELSILKEKENFLAKIQIEKNRLKEIKKSEENIQKESSNLQKNLSSLRENKKFDQKFNEKIQSDIDAIMKEFKEKTDLLTKENENLRTKLGNIEASLDEKDKNLLKLEKEKTNLEIECEKLKREREKMKRKSEIYLEELKFEKKEKHILVNQKNEFEDKLVEFSSQKENLEKKIKNKDYYDNEVKMKEKISEKKENEEIMKKGEYRVGTIIRGLLIYEGSRSYKNASENIKIARDIFVKKKKNKEPKVISSTTLRTSLPGANLFILEKIKGVIKSSGTEDLGVGFEDFSTKLKSSRGHMLVSYPIKLNEEEILKKKKDLAKFTKKMSNLENLMADDEIANSNEKKKKKKEKIKKLIQSIKEDLKLGFKRTLVAITTKPFINTTAEEVAKVYKKDFEILGFNIPKTIITDRGAKDRLVAKILGEISLSCLMHMLNTADQDLCVVVFGCHPLKSIHLRSWRLLSSKSRSKKCIFSTLMRLKEEKIIEFMDLMKNPKELEESLEGFAKEIESNKGGSWALNEGSHTRFKDMHLCAKIILKLRNQLLSICSTGKDWLDACPEWGDKTTYSEIMETFNTDENYFYLNIMTDLFDVFIGQFFAEAQQNDGFISYKVESMANNWKTKLVNMKDADFVNTNDFINKLTLQNQLYELTRDPKKETSIDFIEKKNVKGFKTDLSKIVTKSKERFLAVVEDLEKDYSQFPLLFHSCFSFEENSNNFISKLDNLISKNNLPPNLLNGTVEEKIFTLGNFLITKNDEKLKKIGNFIKDKDYIRLAKGEVKWWDLSNDSLMKLFALQVHNTPITSIQVERSFKQYTFVHQSHSYFNSSSYAQFLINTKQFNVENFDLSSDLAQGLFKECKKNAEELKKKLKQVIFDLQMAAKKFQNGLEISKVNEQKEKEKDLTKRCFVLLTHCYDFQILNQTKVENPLKANGRKMKKIHKDGTPHLYKHQLLILLKLLEPDFQGKISKDDLLIKISSHPKYEETLNQKISLLGKRERKSNKNFQKKKQNTNEPFEENSNYEEDDFSENVCDDSSRFSSFKIQVSVLHENKFEISHPDFCEECQKPIFGLIFAIPEHSTFLCFDCVNKKNSFSSNLSILCSNDGANICQELKNLESSNEKSIKILPGRYSFKMHLKEIGVWEECGEKDFVMNDHIENPELDVAQILDLLFERNGISSLIEKFKSNGYEVISTENSFSIFLKDEEHFKKGENLNSALKRMNQVQQILQDFTLFHPSLTEKTFAMTDIEDGGVDSVIRQTIPQIGEDRILSKEGRFIVSIAAFFSNGAKFFAEANPNGKDRFGWFWGKRSAENKGYCDPNHFSSLLITIKDVLAMYVYSFIKNNVRYAIGHYVSVHDFPIIDLNIRRCQPFSKQFSKAEFEIFWKNTLKIKTIDTKDFNMALRSYLTGKEADKWGVDPLLKTINPNFQEIHNPLLDSTDSLWIFLPFFPKSDLLSFFNSLLSQESSEWSILKEQDNKMEME